MFRIGSLALHRPIIQAPMAGCTDLAFRLLAREHGLELAFLEMISAEALIRETRKTLELLRTRSEDKPLGAQLFGARPESMAEAAGMLEQMGFDILDLNLGCPVYKVIKNGAGCALMAKPDLVRKIFRAVVKRVKKIPVTVKMRKGFRDVSGAEAVGISRLAEEEGLAAVTIHGRTQPQGYHGNADWSVIACVKKEIKIPVIGNGDVFSAERAVALVNSTGCDAIMIGRGSLGNPWLYRDIDRALQGKKVSDRHNPEDIKQAALRHFELELETNQNVQATVKKCRKIIAWYFKSLPHAAQFRKRINVAENPETIRELISSYDFSYNVL